MFNFTTIVFDGTSPTFYSTVLHVQQYRILCSFLNLSRTRYSSFSFLFS